MGKYCMIKSRSQYGLLPKFYYEDIVYMFIILSYEFKLTCPGWFLCLYYSKHFYSKNEVS